MEVKRYWTVLEFGLVRPQASGMVWDIPSKFERLFSP